MTAGKERTSSQLSPARRVTRSRLARLVSQEALPEMTQDAKRSPQYVSGCEDDDGQLGVRSLDDSERSGSPMRCVSEFDEIALAGKPPGPDGEALESSEDSSSTARPQTNPLHNARLRSTHVRALRLEAELQPMRMILGRLMMHPTNRKGLFNVPVNAIALRLLDYHQIIKRPMDLGTVKSMLYSIAYQSRQQVADDIRLVFENAMVYNPANNVVHIAATSLLEFFEELYVAVGGDNKTPAACLSRRVSFAHESQLLLQSELASRGLARTVSTSEADLMVLASPGPKTADAAITKEPDSSPTNVATVNVDGPLSSRVAVGPAEGLPECSLSTMRASRTPPAAPMELKHPRKRRMSVTGKNKIRGHACRSCLGRSCSLCEQSCLPLEPTLLVCNGSNCAGSKIRKGAMYYIASDGSRQYCQRCFASLPPVLFQTAAEQDAVRYKRNLLKRKNDEELVEDWLTCTKCDMGVHRICALHNSHAHASEGYMCPSCVAPLHEPGKAEAGSRQDTPESDVYTFVTGAGCPLRLSDVADAAFCRGESMLNADILPKTRVSDFIEAKVRDRLQVACDIPNVDKTVTIRVISDCDRSFRVPDVVRKHFRMESDGNAVVSPPEKVNFKSKAIALFQKIDGLDVCVFCMYVQEYDGNDDYGDETSSETGLVKSRRVYIAYLDSVEHFRPRSMRTKVYHEVLVAYLASARMRGFETAHIWACPPSRGNHFIFWNHPVSQRTPTKDRLISWYHGALSRAIECGALTDVKSLYESDFHETLMGTDKENESDNMPVDPTGRMVCPPLLEGDYWMEEAVRIHAASLARHLKAKSSSEVFDLDSLPSVEGANDPCPARQIAWLLIDRLMAHASSSPFRRPVNAAALKLKDYHKIVTKPMDLGTIYSRCTHGEYACLGDLVADVELVFSNAKKFNPSGHVVHNMANEMEEFFFKQLDVVVKKWDAGSNGNSWSWRDFTSTSMSLDVTLGCPQSVCSAADCDSTSTDRNEILDANKVTSSSPGFSNPLPISPDRMSGVESNSSHLDKLLTGGPDAVSQRMVGEDKHLLEKKSPFLLKKPSTSKKGGVKRRRSSVSVATSGDEEPSTKRRRQTWLGEEVGASVRSMRTSFFACSLLLSKASSAKVQEKARSFAEYIKGFDFSEDSSAETITSRIADARSALLEFSQRRNLEFATLRHAKYSTAVLLFHLHHPDAPGVVPLCTACNEVTADCRWHKVLKIEELKKAPGIKKHASKVNGSSRADTDAEAADDKAKERKKEAEELCNACHAKHSHKDKFIPHQVTLGAS